MLVSLISKYIYERIQSVNDGKVASWAMHRYLQKLHNIDVDEEPQLPAFFTEIDKVDISVEVAGIRLIIIRHLFRARVAHPCS